MKSYLEERNERIRRDFARLLRDYKEQGFDKPADAAIQQLVIMHNAWELDYESMKQIVYNKNYGVQPRFGLKMKNAEGQWVWLHDERGKPVEFSSKKSAEAGRNKLKKQGVFGTETKIKIKIDKIPPNGAEKKEEAPAQPTQENQPATN